LIWFGQFGRIGLADVIFNGIKRTIDLRSETPLNLELLTISSVVNQRNNFKKLEYSIFILRPRSEKANGYIIEIESSRVSDR
jgi:hypothetical protein